MAWFWKRKLEQKLCLAVIECLGSFHSTCNLFGPDLPVTGWQSGNGESSSDEDEEAQAEEDDDRGGCILAHSMGTCSLLVLAPLLLCRPSYPTTIAASPLEDI